VKVEDDQRREGREQLGDRARFRRLQQEVVAVDVGAVGGAALESRRAVGVGARQQDDVDAIEDAGDAAGSELLRDEGRRNPTVEIRRLMPPVLLRSRRIDSS